MWFMCVCCHLMVIRYVIHTLVISFTDDPRCDPRDPHPCPKIYIINEELLMAVRISQNVMTEKQVYTLLMIIWFGVKQHILYE